MRCLPNTRLTTFALILSLVGFSLLAPSGASAQAGAQLTINGSGEVRVDGVKAATGATIFPGQRITTPRGTSAVLTLGADRVTLNGDTDAIIVFTNGFVRVDIICGSCAAVPSGGTALELITHGDTSVFVPAGAAKVLAEGKNWDMVTDQSQEYAGGIHLSTMGTSTIEASTLLCSCLCAAPAIFPPIIAPFPVGVLLATIIPPIAIIPPILISGPDEPEVVSRPFP